MEHQLNNLERAIGRVEGKLEGILANLEKINGQIGRNTEKINDNENAIVDLKARASIYGAGAGVGIIIIWEIIKNKFLK